MTSSNGMPFSARTIRTFRAYGDGVADISWIMVLRWAESLGSTIVGYQSFEYKEILCL